MGLNFWARQETVLVIVGVLMAVVVFVRPGMRVGVAHSP